jgi:Rieske Fe-S protein
MTQTSPAEAGTSRRSVVAAAAGVAGLVTVLAACGADDKTDAAAEKPADKGVGTAPGTSGAAPEGLVRTADIPEGGGKVFADRKVVVTQPVKGEFKAFSAVCTHQGCVVKDVSDGTINCPCHGSKFSVADGSVKGGPATRALSARPVTVRGDAVQLG